MGLARDMADMQPELDAIQSRVQSRQAEIEAIYQRLVAACENGTPPGCPAEHCRGELEFEGLLLCCPRTRNALRNWEGDCPHAEARELQRRRDICRYLGIGERYAEATIEQIANPQVRGTVRGYCENIDLYVRRGGRGLLLSGGVGTGKTCALALVAIAAREARMMVEYRHAVDLFRDLAENAAGLHCCEMADLLIIDDLGTEYAHEWPQSQFDRLIEHRHAARRPTCVSTNVAPRDMATVAQYARVFDRLRSTCEMLGTGTQSMRQIGGR